MAGASHGRPDATGVTQGAGESTADAAGEGRCPFAGVVRSAGAAPRPVLPKPCGRAPRSGGAGELTFIAVAGGGAGGAGEVIFMSAAGGGAVGGAAISIIQTQCESAGVLGQQRAFPSAQRCKGYCRSVTTANYMLNEPECCCTRPVKPKRQETKLRRRAAQH